jgi:hypothetical protein
MKIVGDAENHCFARRDTFLHIPPLSCELDTLQNTLRGLARDLLWFEVVGGSCALTDSTASTPVFIGRTFVTMQSASKSDAN